MTNALAHITSNQHPKDARTGLTLPLRTSLGSQDLARHRAEIAALQEVLAIKVDRFGWERMRGKAVHDQLVRDWMDALQDYPLEEVQAACRAAILSNPNRMPNEGHVVAEIKAARKKWLELNPPAKSQAEPRRQEPTPEQKARADDLLASAFPGIAQAKRAPGTMREIIKSAAEAGGVSVKDILGPGRTQQVSHARQAAMLAGHRAGLSSTQIGMIMHRDHSTVLHGIRAAEERLQREKEIKNV